MKPRFCTFLQRPLPGMFQITFCQKPSNTIPPLGEKSFKPITYQIAKSANYGFLALHLFYYDENRWIAIQYQSPQKYPPLTWTPIYQSTLRAGLHRSKIWNISDIAF